MEKNTSKLTVTLRGYLIKQTDDELWIRDRDGTLVLKKTDIVGELCDWDGKDPNFDRKAVKVEITDGAEIQEIRHWRIDATGRAITLGEKELSTIRGIDDMDKATLRWARKLGFEAAEEDGGQIADGLSWCGPPEHRYICDSVEN
ncbi:hypothetical protein A1353_00335 [Methylomonas methanica]|uniref:Uncharacterized protein n=1 Tax=Methylomonas methanica TaxID=421 RepID=A0A177MCU3_METMH|nr:hypothetical protein [Methylomonas methanica]OAI03587.1 hypothetical protein A1353_00335 [Methylomonas methanica]